MGAMAKDVIHISDKEAASDFASLLGRVREGAEVVIENDARPVAVIRRAEASRGRLLSKSDSRAFGSPRFHGFGVYRDLVRTEQNMATDL
jgi:antitoxin (DNA-binding transcriptional repressor) of toxin-antitoxin stability system